MVNANFYFPRFQETELISLLGQFPAVGLVGPRQCGKTTLAQKILTQLDRPAIWLDLEFPGDIAKLTEPALFLERYQNEVVVIDEVQRMPGLFPVLRALIDRHRVPGRFLLLGSAAPELIQRSSESLAGRIGYLELAPLAFSEVAEKIGFDQLWLRGGFPESLLATDETASLRWRKNFIQTYVERDLPAEGIRANPVLLNRLLTMLAHFNANLLNKETLSNSLSLNNQTITRYLYFLESAFMIRLLQPFVPRISKRLIKSPKIYWRDTGLSHFLTNIRSHEELAGHPSLGASWEAFVVQQVGLQLPEGWEMFFYRTQAGSEADLVLTNGGTAEILVEIKYSSKPSLANGFHIAQQDLGTKKQFVICPIEQHFPLRADVEAIGLSGISEMFR